MRERFVSEPLEPVTETCDPSKTPPGEPCMPRVFIWKGREVEVAKVLRTWHDTGPCRHGSPEMYVRKHWYEVATTNGETMKIYFDRQPRPGKLTKRWWLFSVTGPSGE